jgi:hypothetical protein
VLLLSEDRARLRDPVFKEVYSITRDLHQQQPGALMGSLFWRLQIDAGYQRTGKCEKGLDAVLFEGRFRVWV